MKADTIARRQRETAAARGVEPGAAVAAVPVEAPKRDLDDPQTQEQILHPEPVVLTAGGEPIELYPLPARWARKFVGVFARVMNATVKTDAPIRIRIGVAIESDDDLARDVFRFIARAEHPADADVDDAAIASRAEQLDEVAGFEERGQLLDRMCEMHRIAELLNPPKRQAASTTPTS